MRSLWSGAIALSLLFLSALPVQAADLENGKKHYQFCALCHGKLGQGIQGGGYPRIAGLPEYYLKHQNELFVSEQRINPAMVTVGRLDTLSEKDLNDLVAYIASIDIKQEIPEFNIPTYTGNAENGEELYDDDCKLCHGKKAQGKKKKDSPPTAGQYSEYLLRQVDFFKKKYRWHDNDEEDETFDEYTDEEILDILTYISTLDDE